MTAAAAAEKKKKKDEMYYRFNTSRGMGFWKSRNRKYDDAVALYSLAIENAEPGLEVPLIIARSKAYSKLVNHEAARQDALAVVENHPEEIRGLENDAYTLYEKDDFEDSLVRNYQGLRKRKKPDNFYRGILVGKETIEDCIGRNAGPCLDHERLGSVIVAMHLKPKPDSGPNFEDELTEAKQKYDKDRIDRFFAQKYLGQLAADKQFLMDLLEFPDLKSGNKEHNRQLQELITNRLQTMNRQQETLMTQRPMYMLKHHKPKFSKKYHVQKQNDDEKWRGGVMKIINKLIEEAIKLQRERQIEACMSVCERLRRFVECQSRQLLPDHKREDVLDELYDILGELYMDTKTFVPTWSDVDNERRIEFILLSQMEDKRFVDKCRRTYFPKMWNVAETRKSLEARLAVSIHEAERAFLYHELSRCLFEAMSTEKAYKAAAKGFHIAKESRNSLWSFNLGFLTALAVLVEGNSDDAKIAFRETNILARRLERDDCASFIQKVIKIAADPNRLNFEPTDSTERRNQEFLTMMPTPELRARAQSVLLKIAKAPRNAKLSLHTQTGGFKPVSQGGSRRSMRMTTRAKRRTLYEVKGSRHQTQAFIPSKVDLPDID